MPRIFLQLRNQLASRLWQLIRLHSHLKDVDRILHKEINLAKEGIDGLKQPKTS